MSNLTEKTVKPRKIGSITLGLCLIIVGITFLFVDFDSVEQIRMLFHMWPLILISLGFEMLVAQKFHPEYAFSVTSIIILIILLGFTFCMAGAEVCFEYAIRYGYIF